MERTNLTSEIRRLELAPEAEGRRGVFYLIPAEEWREQQLRLARIEQEQVAARSEQRLLFARMEKLLLAQVIGFALIENQKSLY